MMMPRFTSQMCLIVLVFLFTMRLNTISCCHESDKSLLLTFKKGVVDPSNCLSSWSTLHDCCLWEGVGCDNTSRVINLDLSSVNNHSESLRGEINLSSLFSLPYLGLLSLGYNDFERISKPSVNNTNLLPNSSSELSFLDLSYNVNLRIDNLHYWLSLLPFLTYLDLSGIPLPSETNWVHSLASLPLWGLFLYDCNLTTTTLSLQYANFSSSLVDLNLGLNDFRYGLPNWLFNLSTEYFTELHLSQCDLRGQIPDFSCYRNLSLLDLSNNKLKGPIPDWLGRLGSLSYLTLSNNSLQGSMPSNLANFSSDSFELDISFNQLIKLHPRILEHHYYSLDLSHNSISGDISKLSLRSEFVDLSFNKFEGQLPYINGVMSLNLAQNSFSGSLFSLLCPDVTKYGSLVYLDISNNFLNGELPDCWMKWPDLSFLYLGSNKLSGEINPTMGSYKLESLDLHDNNFHGQIPRTFQFCTSLVLLNLAGNNFSGSIPEWMPQSVSIVKLRSNHFTGVLPTQLCTLSELILLDLANNSLSGPIPHCLQNLTFMVSGQNSYFSHFEVLSDRILYIKTPYEFRSDLHTKGQDLGYEKNLDLVRGIDLSDNELSGVIPVQLFTLFKLQSLNLSYNYLRGEIPKQIGEMKDLESLDLSHNNLHGNIPESMSSLSFLAALNLSCNHLSGQIPLGTQLQSFSAWSYVGNPELCGAPLPNNCTGPPPPNNTKHIEGNEDDGFLKALYLGMGVGYAVGFWVVCGSLFLNRTCRHTFFLFFDGVVNRIYVFVAIKLRRFR